MFIYGTCWPEGPYWEKLCLTPQAEGDTKDQGTFFLINGPSNMVEILAVKTLAYQLVIPQHSPKLLLVCL